MNDLRCPCRQRLVSTKFLAQLPPPRVVCMNALPLLRKVLLERTPFFTGRGCSQQVVAGYNTGACSCVDIRNIRMERKWVFVFGTSWEYVGFGGSAALHVLDLSEIQLE